MSKYDNDNSIIRGYSAAEAIRRARSRMTSESKKENENPKQKTDNQKSSDVSSRQKSNSKEHLRHGSPRIGHTTIPDRFEIICYECGYQFTLPGRIHETYCPKCRQILDSSNLTVSGSCSDSIKTIGNVKVENSAILNDAFIMGRDIILDGNASNSTLRATNTLHINKDARFNITRIRMKSLVIGPEARVEIQRNISCHNIEICGDLKANIMADGIAIIDHQGSFTGKLFCQGLIVRDGAKMQATIQANRRPMPEC